MVVKVPDGIVNVVLPDDDKWSMSVKCCPKCKDGLNITITTCCCKDHAVTKRSPLVHIIPRIINPNWLPESVRKELPPVVIGCPNNESLKRLGDSYRMLHISGWYYGSLDWQGSKIILRDKNIGTFLIRDSSNGNNVFTLSLQTEKGVTSVRLDFDEGYFRLDCNNEVAKYMPRFRTVLDLIQYYIDLGDRGTIGTVWVDREGCTHSRVLLKRPLLQRPPALTHLARLKIHQALNANPNTPKLKCAPNYRLLPLPSKLIEYLAEYPFSI